MKILILAPHPDDATIGCGGTIAKHIKEGDEVKVIYLTSGEKGGDPEIREEEAREAMQILGVKDLEFWKLPDAELERIYLSVIGDKLEEYIPHLIYFPCSTECHRDHTAVYNTMRFFQFPRGITYEVFPGLPKIQNKDCVDITPYMDKKIAALKCFKSQKLNLAEAYTHLARFRGIFTGLGKYVECFQPYA